jgi:uncharacterized protein YndB with AHSA1/START domain
MSTLTAEKDLDQLTLTFVAEFDAPPSRVWEIWEDPRQLERWWGPPTWPATFSRHELSPGSESAYFMTGPDGERAHGWWEITAVRAPESLSYDDGFADEHGARQEGMGVVHATVTLEALGTGTRMTIENRFDSLEQLEQLLAMGMEEGMGQAMGQIDALLAA